jgi:hypothetical protein
MTASSDLGKSIDILGAVAGRGPGSAVFTTRGIDGSRRSSQDLKGRDVRLLDTVLESADLCRQKGGAGLNGGGSYPKVVVEATPKVESLK